jgi:hypothetical protein
MMICSGHVCGSERLWISYARSMSPRKQKIRNSTYRQRNCLLRVELKIGQEDQHGSRKFGDLATAHALRKIFAKRRFKAFHVRFAAVHRCDTVDGRTLNIVGSIRTFPTRP